MKATALRRAREAWRMTQAAAAELAGGVDIRTYRRWENDESPTPPIVATLFKILVASAEARKIVGLPE